MKYLHILLLTTVLSMNVSFAADDNWANDPDSLCRMAQEMYQQRKFDESIELFKNALSRNQLNERKRARALIHLSQAFGEINNYPEQKAAILAALDANALGEKNTAKCFYFLGVNCDNLGDYAGAMKNLTYALGIAELPEVYRDKCRSKLNDVSQRIEIALESKRNTLNDLINSGKECFTQHEIIEAIANLEATLAMRDWDGQKKILCMDTLARGYKKIGNLDKAIEWYDAEQVIPELLGKARGVCLYDLAKVYREKKKPQMAVKYFNEALYTEGFDGPERTSCFDDLLKIEVKRAYVICNLATECFKNGDINGAIKSCTEALTMPGMTLATLEANLEMSMLSGKPKALCHYTLGKALFDYTFGKALFDYNKGNEHQRELNFEKAIEHLEAAHDMGLLEGQDEANCLDALKNAKASLRMNSKNK